MKQLNLQIDAELHQAVKLAAVEKRVTVRHFVEDLLRKATAKKGSTAK